MSKGNRLLKISALSKISFNGTFIQTSPYSAAQNETVGEVGYNTSRLLPHHRNVLKSVPPYEDPRSWIHLTEKYKRMMFGRYGFKSNVSPRICFEAPTSQLRISDIAEPITLQQSLEKDRMEKSIAASARIGREEEIAKKIDKLQLWKSELKAKIAKREADALLAKQRKERMIEEVRRYFGFKVDPRDERFKEMMEQKEKEEKRKQKEAKQKAKNEKMMAKLVTKTSVAK